MAVETVRAEPVAPVSILRASLDAFRASSPYKQWRTIMH